MVKGTPPEVAPPGLRTVTVAVPPAATRDAGTCAVSWVALPKVVGRAWPFHATCAPCRKLAPFTVRVKAAAPAFAVDGLREESVAAGWIVNGSELVETPSSVVADTEAVP